MKTRTVEGVVFLSYVRANDGTKWTYRCKVEGDRIMWASDPGRWRNSPLDEKLFYKVVKDKEGDRLEVEERYSDGSSTRKAFAVRELGN
jgi:hypothetical protein